jgi:hypothetical protein
MLYFSGTLCVPAKRKENEKNSSPLKQTLRINLIKK